MLTRVLLLGLLLRLHRTWHLILVSTLCSFGLIATLNAQEMPTTCVQSPQRTSVCPNLMYKRSAVDLAVFGIKQGDMVCICMSDFARLRLEATDEQGKIDQLAAASLAAASLQISETELLKLLRR